MMSEQTAKLVRAVGFWGLVAMCINAVVGSGVFLLPTESYKLLGPFSLWAPLLFAVPGFILVALIAWRTNPIPASMHLPGPGTDWSAAALFMLFAYAGFENMGVPAGEFRDPKKELPRALLVGTLAIAAIYVLAQLGAMSALPDLSKTSTPIADAAAVLVGGIGAVVVTLGALLSMAGTNSGTVL